MLRMEQKRQEKPRRKKVTLYLDAEPYDQMRDLLKQARGFSVSDLVSDMLRTMAEEFVPMINQMLDASPRERLKLIEKLYGELSGQSALEFARTYEYVAKRGEEEERQG